MNYLIVMPAMVSNPNQTYFFPIGMAYVSASLKQTGRNVFTYNLNYKEGSVEDNLRKVITENKIDVVMTGGLTGQYRQLKEIVDVVKKIKYDAVICVGGGIITASPAYAMEALEFVDYGMIGEGEITICELAETLEGLRDRHTVDGLVFKENGEWVLTSPRKEIMDLDSLPLPDYEGFEYGLILDKQNIEALPANGDRYGFVSFSRSCPFNCTFCFHPSGTKYRRRSMDNIFAEIDYLIEKYSIKNISVEDELFATNIDDVREFCKRIKERHLGFMISMRVDRVSAEMLMLLKESGCLSIGFGLESADNTILKSMRKHITVEQIEHALKLCQEIGITFQGNFIFGDQAETYETAMNTINWWKAHPEYQIKLVMIILYPGSELFNVALRKGLIKDPVQFIKDGCPYVNLSKMTDQEYRDVALLTSLLVREETERLKNASVIYEGAGKVALTGQCPICGKQGLWENLEVYRSMRGLICDGCGHAINVTVANYTDNQAEINWKKLSSHKVAIWPVVASVSSFFEKVPTAAAADNLFLIDSSPLKQGGRLNNKTVYSSSILEEEQIDTVFISITTPVSGDIIWEIEHSHPSVKNIFFLGDLIDKNFSIK